MLLRPKVLIGIEEVLRKEEPDLVAGVEPEGILRSALMMIERKREWPNPFGDGHAAERIVKILKSEPS